MVFGIPYCWAGYPMTLGVSPRTTSSETVTNPGFLTKAWGHELENHCPPPEGLEQAISTAPVLLFNLKAS